MSSTESFWAYSEQGDTNRDAIWGTAHCSHGPIFRNSSSPGTTALLWQNHNLLYSASDWLVLVPSLIWLVRLRLED